jgi:hypothetical protein
MRYVIRNEGKTMVAFQQRKKKHLPASTTGTAVIPEPKKSSPTITAPRIGIGAGIHCRRRRDAGRTKSESLTLSSQALGV